MKWSTKLPKVRLTNILKHEGVVKEAVFSKDETRILTWSFDRTARLWDVPGDLDFPQEYFSLQVEALTGTRFDPITRQMNSTKSKRNGWKLLANMRRFANIPGRICISGSVQRREKSDNRIERIGFKILYK